MYAPYHITHTSPPIHITHASPPIHTHTHVPNYDPYLSQFVGAVQRLKEGVHVASGTLVLETNKASVLTRVPAAHKSRQISST